MNARLDLRKSKMDGAPTFGLRKFRITRSFFGYVLAAVLLLLFFLYLRFPGDAVRDYLKAAAAAHYPDTLFVVDSIEPVIPPGISLKNMTFAFRESPEATLHADTLAFSPGWASLMKGKAAVAVSASLYDGDVRVNGEMAKSFSLTGPLSAKARFSGIRLEKCLILQSLFSRHVSGTLKGSFSANGVGGSRKNVVGSLDAAILNGSYQLMESLAGFDKINFSRIDLKMELKGGVLKISSITVNGDKLRIALKGNILLADDLQESRMDLTGSVELQGLGGRRMPITIGGVFGKPTMKLM
jgi:type II secretion system protein N